MKSFKKGILALGLTLGIIASVGGGAFAASSSGRINGYTVYGYSHCSPMHSYASTSFVAPNCYVAVNTIYNYVNTKTLSTGTKSSSSSRNNYSVSLTLYAPNNCLSVNESSTHVASTGGQSWTGFTNERYYA